jgi:aspartate dehydrogenase
VADLAERCDAIVECAPAAAFRAIAAPAIANGRMLVTLSAGALLDHMDLVTCAERTGGRIVVPTGALLGLDAVRAAREGRIASVKLISRKPPGGLAGAPYLLARGIALDGLASCSKAARAKAFAPFRPM